MPTGTRLNAVVYEAVAKDAALRLHAVIVTDAETGIIVYATERAEQMFGYGPRELEGLVVEVLLPESKRGRHHAYRDDFNAAPRARPMGHGMILFALKKDGKQIPVQVGLSPEEMLGRKLVVAFVVDLSEPVKAANQISKLVKAGDAAAKGRPSPPDSDAEIPVAPPPGLPAGTAGGKGKQP